MRLITLPALLLLAAIAPAFAGPFDDGLAAYKSGEWAKAFEILKPLAELDNSQSAVAQERLAHLYQRGNGAPKDMAAAAKWFKKAAEGGSVTASAHLGRLYRLGLGVPKNGVETGRWSIKAASQGNAIAESNLGYMALEGIGGPADAASAAGWFKRSAEQGDATQCWASARSMSRAGVWRRTRCWHASGTCSPRSTMVNTTPRLSPARRRRRRRWPAR